MTSIILNTSENWLKSEDFIASEFEGIVEEVTRSVIESTGFYVYR
jgi:hypothetical protein